MQNTIKRALVTGGAGFIGSHIVEELVGQNYQVTVIDNLSTGFLSNLEPVLNQIHFIQADIRDYGQMAEICRNMDVIFHQAAIVSIPQTIEQPIESAMVNDIGTLNVLEAARQNNVKRIVMASSCAVYGDEPTLPKVETLPVKPLTPYAVQKLGNELYAKLYVDLFGMEIVCLRYFNVFGPRQDPSSPYSGVISVFMTKAVLNERPVIFGDGLQYRDFIYVKDVVGANLLAATSQNISFSSFNVGTGSVVTINKLWELVDEKTNNGSAPIYKEARSGDIKESQADISQITNELGFLPAYSFEQGLELTFNWYKLKRESTS